MLYDRDWYTFRCALGKPSTPTPAGNWIIREKVTNPSWEVLGSHWMGLNVPTGNYGIHGTNAPWSIGHYISNGCIRLLNEHIQFIFPLVPIGTPIRPVLNALIFTLDFSPAERDPTLRVLASQP